MLQLFGGNDAPGGRAEIILEAVGNHHDAVTARTLSRLDDEIPMGFHHPVQGADALFGGNGAVQLRHPNARIQRHLLGLQLVVHQRIETAFVITENVITVALVDPHYATGTQGLAGL